MSGFTFIIKRDAFAVVSHLFYVNSGIQLIHHYYRFNANTPLERQNLLDRD